MDRTLNFLPRAYPALDYRVGIWPSSENLHLYYRLRQSYGDQRLLHEAPGHLFLDYERDDLTSFLQVAIANGWGGYIAASSADPWFAFFSHDEYIDFYADEDAHLADVKKHYEDLLKPQSDFHSAAGRQRISAEGAPLSPEEVHGKPEEAHNEDMPNARIRADVGDKHET